ncbi:N-alpha-acetyltransferase 40 [Alternaria panax]|uniref:N-alpha-acetyltransferase 40 n=1 Tax=Alternaria panax TaxID=48097 RepID=A0AAD4NW35_9PLEO|nr:N-alpha-acetyltransferase 40 [Alternaria panax]
MPNHAAHASTPSSAALSSPPPSTRRPQRELPDMDVCQGQQHSPDLAKQPTHVVARVQAVQALLREDAYLSAYGAPHLPCPLSFEFVASALDLSKGELETCLSLVSKTSAHDYRASSVGWDPRKKREEMLDGDMMYLLVRQRPADRSGQSSTQDTQEMKKLRTGTHWTQPSSHDCILGFTSFMFTQDDPPHQDRHVLYIYEIHLEEQLRGQGLGPCLVRFVENAARACQIRKTMLTVFTANARAKSMYESLGYTRDDASPNDRVTRNRVIQADYLIMSKSID